MEQKEKKKLWKWLVIAVAFIFFAFMAILPFAWEDGDDVPAPNPTISELLGVAYTQIRNPDSNLSLLGRS